MSDDRQKQTSLSPVVIKARFLENYYSSFKDKDYVKFINADNFAKQAYEFVDASICKNEIFFTNLQKQFLLKTFQKMYDQPETVQHLITTMYLAKLMTDEIDKKHSFKENFKMSKSDFVFAMGIHDVGKIIIPKDILLSDKKFAYASKEKDIINQHSYYGSVVLKLLLEEIISDAKILLSIDTKKAFENLDIDKNMSFEEKVKELEDLDDKNFSEVALKNKGIIEIVKNHHEGMAKNPVDKETFLYTESIMLSQIIDTLDALVQERCYKKGLEIDKAVEFFNTNIKKEIKTAAVLDITSVFGKDNDNLSSDFAHQFNHICSILDFKFFLNKRKELENKFIKEFESELKHGKEVIDLVNKKENTYTNNLNDKTMQL